MANLPRARPRLTKLPYDVLYKILSLVLPYVPPRVRLCLDTALPSWLSVFSRGAARVRCPPILLVCRLLNRYALRILYGQTRLSIHSDRSFLTKISKLKARRYIQKLDLALGMHPFPSIKHRNDVCKRFDIASFYAPAYLIDLLHRIFPQLMSVHLTIVEIEDTKDRDEGDITHPFLLSSLTQSSTIDPARWNNLITSIRYKASSSFTTPLPRNLPSRLGFSKVNDDPEEEKLGALQQNVLQKFTPLSPAHLPNLSQVVFYVITNKSRADDPKNGDTGYLSLDQEYNQLRDQFDVICGEELYGSSAVEVWVVRTVIRGPRGQTVEVGWSELIPRHTEALVRNRRAEGHGKGKGKAREVAIHA
jgi:hypothetical protein